MNIFSSEDTITNGRLRAVSLSPAQRRRSQRLVTRLAASVCLLAAVTGCGERSTVTVGAVAQNPVDGDGQASETSGTTRAALDYQAQLDGVAAVKAAYGVDWPMARVRTIDDGKEIVCSKEPPAKMLNEAVAAITEKYGNGPQELVLKGGADNTRPTPPKPGETQPPGRDAPTLLCDGTQVWLEEVDPFYDGPAARMAYDAPEGGNELGLYDPADPTRLK